VRGQPVVEAAQALHQDADRLDDCVTLRGVRVAELLPLFVVSPRRTQTIQRVFQSTKRLIQTRALAGELWNCGATLLISFGRTEN